MNGEPDRPFSVANIGTPLRSGHPPRAPSLAWAGEILASRQTPNTAASRSETRPPRSRVSQGWAQRRRRGEAELLVPAPPPYDNRPPLRGFRSQEKRQTPAAAGLAPSRGQRQITGPREQIKTNPNLTRKGSEPMRMTLTSADQARTIPGRPSDRAATAVSQAPRNIPEQFFDSMKERSAAPA